MTEKNKEPNDIEYKIITLGNAGVGKTSIIQRFLSDNFNPDQLTTLGISFNFKTITINKTNLKLKLIDTGGQEKYRSLSLSYFRHADVVLFVFDLNSENSFNSIQYWIDLFNDNNGDKNVKSKYLIGNKNDLEQKVKQNIIDDLVKANNLTYISTSAKTKTQIDEMFLYIGEELYEYTITKAKNKPEGKSAQRGKVLSQTNFEDEKPRRKCCG